MIIFFICASLIFVLIIHSVLISSAKTEEKGLIITMTALLWLGTMINVMVIDDQRVYFCTVALNNSPEKIDNYKREDSVIKKDIEQRTFDSNFKEIK